MIGSADHEPAQHVLGIAVADPVVRERERRGQDAQPERPQLEASRRPCACGPRGRRRSRTGARRPSGRARRARPGSSRSSDARAEPSGSPAPTSLMSPLASLCSRSGLGARPLVAARDPVGQAAGPLDDEHRPVAADRRLDLGQRTRAAAGEQHHDRLAMRELRGEGREQRRLAAPLVAVGEDVVRVVRRERRAGLAVVLRPCRPARRRSAAACCPGRAARSAPSSAMTPASVPPSTIAAPVAPTASRSAGPRASRATDSCGSRRSSAPPETTITGRGVPAAIPARASRSRGCSRSRSTTTGSSPGGARVMAPSSTTPGSAAKRATAHPTAAAAHRKRFSLSGCHTREARTCEAMDGGTS